MAHLTLAGAERGRQAAAAGQRQGRASSPLDIDARPPGRTARRAPHDSASWRFRWTAHSVPATSRPGSGPARPPRPSPQAAQTTVDKIMPFAGPVLAERAARRRARPAVVGTPRPASPAGARTLGDAVAAHLRSLQRRPGHRRRGTPGAARTAAGRSPPTFDAVRARSGTAEFTYDAPGNYVVAENDDARWLVGEARRRAPGRRRGRDDLQQARQRRLSAVPEDELPLGDDAIELVRPQAEPDDAVGLTEPRRSPTPPTRRRLPPSLATTPRPAPRTSRAEAEPSPTTPRSPPTQRRARAPRRRARSAAAPRCRAGTRSCSAASD